MSQFLTNLSILFHGGINYWRDRDYFICLQFFPVLGQLRYPEEEARGEVVEKLDESAALLEDAFVKASKGKGFFGGETVGFVDIALGSLLGWLRVIETTANVKIIHETKTPALVEWAERFSSHKSIKGTLPETEELLNYHKKTTQARAAAAAAQASKWEMSLGQFGASVVIIIIINCTMDISSFVVLRVLFRL